MEQRKLGRSELMLSVLGFGCGAVGGLLVRGSTDEQLRTVGRAIELGINYFDTAAAYGDGQSETNLGRALSSLSSAKVLKIGTKVRVVRDPASPDGTNVLSSLDQSLKRLRRDFVDIFHIHTFISGSTPGALSAARMLNEIVPLLETAKRAGKTRHIGLTAMGDTEEIRSVLRSGLFDSAQIVFNILNPSSSFDNPKQINGQDYSQLMKCASLQGAGILAIRVLAGGALTDPADRHPFSLEPPKPMGSSETFSQDVARAQRVLQEIEPLELGSLTSASIRFAISDTRVTSAIVGFSSLEHLEQAAAAVNQGALSQRAINHLLKQEAR